MNIKKADINFGLTNETIVMEQLNKHFNIELQTLGTYSEFDFIDTKSSTVYELKTRRVNVNSYNTTMIGLNKIKFIQSRPEYNAYFVFKFNEGVYYIKYDNDLFKKFMTKVSGRTDRGKNEFSPYIYIPVNLLTKLE